MLKIAFIDHYDSFSFNLIEWLAEASQSISIEQVYYDDADALSKLKKFPIPSVISPGPKSPEDIPETISFIQDVWGKAPLLGVCLGHQALCYSRGFTIGHALDPHHGAVRPLSYLQDPIFKGCDELNVVTYNSLIVNTPEYCNDSEYKIIATDQSGQLQAIKFLGSKFPIYGLQFHPEAHLTKLGPVLARNWLKFLGQ